MEQRAHITFNHNPVNPDTDVAREDKVQVQRGRLNRYDTTVPLDVHMVHVYSAEGHLKGVIPQDRYNLLRDRFEHIAQHHPEVLSKHGVHTFEQELVHLLERYHDGYGEDQVGDTQMRHHWAVPAPFMRAIRESCHVTDEGFASPFNFSPYLQRYFSMYPRDEVFGAVGNRYQYPLQGSNQLNPEYEAKAMDKAVRWAIHSAVQQEARDRPVMALMFLPNWECTAYQQHNTSYLHVLATFPDGYFRFQRHTRHSATLNMADPPKWGVRLILIANKPGQHEYYHHKS